MYRLLPHDQQYIYDSFETAMLKGLYMGRLTKTIYKTKCMEDFCLTSNQMEELKCELAPNPHPYAKYPMKLYKEEEVLLHAIKKHGGWEKFTLALQKKAARRSVKQEKQNNSPMVNRGILKQHTAQRLDIFENRNLIIPFEMKNTSTGNLSGMSRKRQRDLVANEERGFVLKLKVKRQPASTAILTSLKTSRNNSNVLIYHCRCGYSAGQKKMTRHLQDRH